MKHWKFTINDYFLIRDIAVDSRIFGDEQTNNNNINKKAAFKGST